MPLKRMEPALVEERDKVIKKKKKADTDLKSNMKITDHFKTPEKEVQLVSKQKSLLQFFTKTAAVIATSDAKEKSLPVSDKENTHSKKSIVFPKWASSDESSKQVSDPLKHEDESKNHNCIEILDDSIDSKELVNGEKLDDDQQDSVVMLSDTNNTEDHEGKSEASGTKQTKTEILASDINESNKKSDTLDEKKGFENDHFPKDEVDGKHNNDQSEIDEKVNVKSDSLKHSSHTDVNEEIKQDLAATDSKESKGPVVKKSTLKGSEMMSLLKEIKNSEKNSEKNTEKKEKKKKHKHKDKTKGHVQEVTDPNFAAKEEKGDTDKTDDEVKSYPIENEASSTKADGEKDMKKKKESGTKEQDKKSLKKKGKAKKTLVEKKAEPVETDTAKAAPAEETDQDSKPNASSTCDTVEGKQETDVKEMSYSDYLMMMDKDKDDDDDDDKKDEGDKAGHETETFTKIVDSGEHKEETIELIENFTTDKTSLKQSSSDTLPTNAGIARFFNVKTSTPNKQTPKSGKASTPNKQTKKSVNSNNENEEKKKLNPVSTVNKSITKTKAAKKTSKKETEEEPHSDLEISIIEIAPVKQKSKFLKSSSKTVFPDKTKQATLAFGSAGLTMSKQPADTPTSDLEPDDRTPSKLKRRPGRPKRVAEVNKPDALDTTSDSVFETPVQAKRGRKRKKAVVSDSTDLEEGVAGQVGGDRRRSARKKYKVTAFQMDYTQKTPIKLKLQRCVKSSSSGDEELAQLKILQHQVKMKLTKAQLLLEKARKNQKKYKGKSKMANVKSGDGEDKSATQETESSTSKDMKKSPKKITEKSPKKNTEKSTKKDTEKPPKIETVKVTKKEKKTKIKPEKALHDPSRRSSRLGEKCRPSMEEVSLENIVISSDDETDEPSVKKRGRPKGSVNKVGSPKKEGQKPGSPRKNPPKIDTPKKSAGTPKKTPKKGGKLAPLFMMGKSKGPAAASPVKPPLDPEQSRQRQQFLMSGVPQELRKQTAVRLAAVVEADYPPVPTINHVQQIPDNISSDSSWSLKKMDLRLRPLGISGPLSPRSSFSRSLTTNSAVQLDLACFKEFQGHGKLEESQMEEFLGEVASFNPTYPVHKVYKALKQGLPQLTSGLQTEEAKVAAKPSEEVITIEDEAVPAKKRARRSLKLQKKGEEEDQKPPPVVEAHKPDTAGKGPCVLWTDKYYPSSSTEVLGNSTLLKKLRNWLSEWKHVLDREARRARKLLMKKNKGKPAAKTETEDQWDDDSDFDLDSEDSEDEDSSLCNTMLLQGPSGCGKTCSVYALAQELGFKVHEVNASSSRSGRHIMSQLQEATQSHQVSSQGCSTPSKKAAAAAAAPDKPLNPKVSSAFSTFFKKTTDAKSDKTANKEKKRKRHLSDKDGKPEKKRRKKEGEVTAGAQDELSQQALGGAAINLSSTTCILFDEVDVFFEEDRGFLSAVQTFMSTTKIPILLTTSNLAFSSQFDGRYEQLTLRPPPVRSIVSRLQTIALLENVRTDVDSLSELVQCYHSDVRKSVVSLQFLLESGGSHILKYCVPQKPGVGGKTLPTIIEDSQDSQDFSQGSQAVKSDTKDREFDDDEDDFVVARLAPNRRKRILDEDSSVSGEMFAEMFLQKAGGLGSGEMGGENDAEARKYPPVHVVGMEAACGVHMDNNKTLLNSMLDYLKGDSPSISNMLDVCTSLRRSIDCDILHSNLPVILPLAAKVVDSVAKATDKNKKLPLKRIRIQSDLYDSEASNDATEDTPAEPEEVKVTNSKEENLCLSRALSSFANYYDTASMLDIMETGERSQLMSSLQHVCNGEVRGRLVSGMETSLPQHPVATSEDLEPVWGYSGEVGARSTARLYREVEEVQSRVEKLCDDNPAFSEEFVLPVTKGRETFRLSHTDSISRPAEAKRACDNVQDSLPLVTHKHRRNLHTDYLPTLREMCRFEQCRQITNTKRRFQHYFNSVNLSLKDRTVATLSTTFL